MAFIEATWNVDKTKGRPWRGGIMPNIDPGLPMT